MVDEWALSRETEDADLLSGILLRNSILERYGYDMMKDGMVYNIYTTVLFNPYYSLRDILASMKDETEAFLPYAVFVTSDGFKDMSLLGQYDYEIPFYNINGDLDYQTNYSLAC